MVIGLSGVQFDLVIIEWLINQIGPPRNGSSICKSRVRLHTELDDTITISHKSKKRFYNLCFIS